MKLALSSACLILASTAFVSCEPDPAPDTTDYRTDYEKLRDNAAKEVVDNLSCKECHDDNGSGIVFDSLSGEDVEAALVAYIKQDNPANAAKAKRKPNGLTDHAGGAPLARIGFEEQNLLWSEFVDTIAETNPPSYPAYSESLSFITTNLVVNNGDEDGCRTCHGIVQSTDFNMLSDSETDIESGIATYLDSSDVLGKDTKAFLLGKPFGLYGHQGDIQIDEDSETIINWYNVVESLARD